MSRFPKSGGQSVSGDGAAIGDPSIKDCRYASTAGQSVASRASIQTTTP